MWNIHAKSSFSHVIHGLHWFPVCLYILPVYFDIFIIPVSYETFYVSLPLFSPIFSWYTFVLCCVFARMYARLRVCLCVRAWACCACWWCSRRRGPPQAQTNSPFSLKAMTSVHSGHRQQVEQPAGKEDEYRKLKWCGHWEIIRQINSLMRKERNGPNVNSLLWLCNN